MLINFKFNQNWFEWEFMLLHWKLNEYHETVEHFNVRLNGCGEPIKMSNIGKILTNMVLFLPMKMHQKSIYIRTCL